MTTWKRIKNKIRYIRYQRAISTDSVEDRFSNIYKKKLWFRNGESQSGSGSTLEATKQLREELPEILIKLKCNTLLDLGCGDFNWMKEVKLPCNYIGVDIVKSVIENNKVQYASESVQFMHINPGNEPLPSSDVILCREVLFHLSLDDCYSILQNMLQSGASHIIITNHKETVLNKDIRSGEFRNLNMRSAPFNFPEPKISMKDDQISRSRTLDVWSVKDIKLDRSLFND